MKIVKTLVVLCILFQAGVSSASTSAPNEIVDNWQDCVGAKIVKVIKARKKAGRRITHMQIQSATGIIQSRVSEIRLGKKPISLAQGMTLAALFDVDPAWLLCFDSIRETFNDSVGNLELERQQLNGFFYGVANYALSLPRSRRTSGREPELDQENAPESFVEAWQISVGGRINQILRDRANSGSKLTASDIEQAVGVSKARISDIRTGKSPISLTQGLALANFLNVDAAWLLDFAAVRREYGNDLRKLEVGQRGYNNFFYRVAHYALTQSPADLTPAAAAEKEVEGADPDDGVGEDEAAASASAPACGKLLRTATLEELVDRIQGLGWRVELTRAWLPK